MKNPDRHKYRVITMLTEKGRGPCKRLPGMTVDR
jgi:hypothetical protein